MNAGLRPLVAGDATWLDAWLPQTAGSVDYDGLDHARSCASLLARATRERNARVRVIERDGATAGIAIYRLRTPRPSSAIIELIATPVAFARKGSGMSAARLVEDEMATAGVRTIYAPVAAKHGISMYFWIRLGYRPLLRTEWPCERAGVAWLRRELGAGS